MRVLIIDNDKIFRDGLSRLPKQKGWRVAAANGVNRGELLAEAKSILTRLRDTEKTIFDVMILDIRYPDDKHGGYFIFQSLVAGNLRDHWKETIIWSIYRDYEHDELRRLYSFAQDSGIPRENVIGKMGLRDALIIRRICELFPQTNAK